MKTNHKQLILARQYKGITQTELSSQINGLSQSTLSKFEKGIGDISEDLMQKIAEYLGFPLTFFKKDISLRIENFHYRKRASTGVKDVSKLESTFIVIGDMLDSMTDEVIFPEFSLSYINIEDGYSINKIAEYTRRLMGLKYDEPVKDIMGKFEKAGIIIVEMETSIDSFDGVSIISNKGLIYICINKKMSNDRKRFTLAHELGHIVMHLSTDFIISDYRDKEKEANQFASEFLMPSDVIKNSLFDLKMSYLGDLKRYWLTSMASIVRRAKDVNAISAERYKYLSIELSRAGYKKNEPIAVYIDSAQIISQSYKLFKNQLEYSDNDLSEAFDLPISIFKDLFEIDNKRIRLAI